MRLQQIELWAIAVTDSVLAGKRVEDSRVECKSTWPPASKARQLAAHANSAGGAEILWLIGVDEDNHRLTDVSETELSNWWAQVESYFDDGITPDMQSVVVTVKDGAPPVTALVFNTDRAPYVVKASGGTSERDVPIRSGTRTRSARRHELLRLLAPSINIPAVSLIAAELDCTYFTGNPGPYGQPKSPERVEFAFTGDLFIEHTANGALMLPAHQLVSEIKLDHEVRGMWTNEVYYDDLTRLYRRHDQPAPASPMYGIDVRPDGLMVTASGVARIRGRYTLDGDYRNLMGDVRSVSVTVRVGIAGSPNKVEVAKDLVRTSYDRPLRVTEGQSEELGSWIMHSSAYPLL